MWISVNTGLFAYIKMLHIAYIMCIYIFSDAGNDDPTVVTTKLMEVFPKLRDTGRFEYYYSQTESCIASMFQQWIPAACLTDLSTMIGLNEK